MGFMKICTVIRRIGGLEIYVNGTLIYKSVIRRIGGLEISNHSYLPPPSVIRRIGGLENLEIL